MASPVENCRAALELLRNARDLLAEAGAMRAADKVRLAITSTGGAIRHAEGKAIRPPFNPED
jgi:hypothetical protein